MVTIKILGDKEERVLNGLYSGYEILKELGMSASSTIILRKGKPIPEDSIIEESDSLTIISSFSGG